MIPKKLLIINDMAGYGRCSMTVALPIVSACKVQAVPVPTSIFSNHTGFEAYYKKDLTVYLTDYLNQLTATAGSFDGIYCGYFGSLIQMHILDDYMNQQKKETGKIPFLIIDPVMADHGKLYRSITPDFCEQMKRFIAHGDLLTPNITEACFLTDTKYKEGPWSKEELVVLADKLCDMGASSVVITGIQDVRNFYNFIRQPGHEDTLLSNSISGSSRPGTGDIFASIIAALSLRGFSLQQAASHAASYIAKCTQASDEARVPIPQGVIFENYLYDLTCI